MTRRDDEFRRGVERPQFGAYDGTGDEHGEPREYHYGHGFDKPERGRWAGQDREDIYSEPYDRWSPGGYVFYAGKGYHREFIDPWAAALEPEEREEGGRGWQVVRERRPPGRFTGRGPKGYVRSDERIWEEINERLEAHGDIDASDMTVTVSKGEATLEGTVEDRRAKRLAEGVAESVRGVRDVHNRLRVTPSGAQVDVDVHGPASHSGTGFLTENRETAKAKRDRR